MPFSFALVLQLSAISARLLSLLLVTISGDIEKFNFFMLRTDPGVLRAEPFDDAERKLRGVYGALTVAMGDENRFPFVQKFRFGVIGAA